ncbi:MBL fold metallo-hydrolase [Phenylobacterium sp.]|uniref:MBL fold metallo-hydrolase n=1 Tax=Phenylobacterium sp. TaxID=1871053 RepID=UPI00120CE1B2|nr:MBL fold metallo-hydrolase [Phenylobacterium sp.]THD73165.1 MAG: MBL fold metallo-hydrolase [Phenylobacterium sp.]
MNKMMMAAGVAAVSLMAGAVFAQPPGGPPPGGGPGGPPGGAPGGGGPPPQQPLQIKEVKTGVYMVVGNGGNSTVVVGPTGVVLVDTKNPGEKIYDELNDKIKSVTPLPVDEVVITHHHADHSGNTLLFENHGVPVIGQQQEMQALQTYASTATPRPTAPSITYETELTTTAGGVKVEAHHWGAGHTAGDTVVYFPAQKVVSGGDEVVSTTPNIDYPFGGSVTGWLTSLDAISKLDFDVIIPGHGNDPLTKAQFLDYAKKWHTFADRARAAVKAGTPKDKLMAAIKTDDLGWNVTTGQWTPPARLDPFYAEMSK